MKKVWFIVTVIVLVLLRAAGGFDYWRWYWIGATSAPADVAAQAVQPRIALDGAAEALPRATADAELIAPEALTAATDAARRLHARALIVHRHGHVVHEYFRAGTSGATEVTGGELVPALPALALGVLVETGRLAPGDAIQGLRDTVRRFDLPGWRNPWSYAARRRFSLAAAPPLLLKDADGSVAQTIAQRVWLPLHAHAAALWGRDDRALRVDCCAVAQLEDWMRIGDLLLQQGNFEGERIASPDWVRRLLGGGAAEHPRATWLDRQAAWVGAEPPAARGALWFDLGANLRLWLVPRRSLAVLLWTDSHAAAADTEIPNIILRGLIDQAPPVEGANALDQLVPGH